MDFEPGKDELKKETMDMEMTPVCIDIKKKAKKGSRAANILCHKTSKTYSLILPKLQTTSLFKSQTQLTS